MTLEEDNRPDDLSFTKHFHMGNWTTEALIDRFVNYIVGVKSKHISHHYGTNKYLARVADFISTSDWSDNHRNIFNIDFSDLLFGCQDKSDEIIAYELIDLFIHAYSTLNYVLHEVVKRLFALCSASWFFQSAETENQIIVRLRP